MGTGIERIRAALEREGCPKVNIRFNTMFTLEFPRPTYVRSKNGALKPLEVTPPQVTPQVTPQVRRLIEALQDEMARAEIMKKLGLKDRAHFRREYLVRAMESGFIEMTIPEKPNSRLQKYRLTRKGKTYVAK